MQNGLAISDSLSWHVKTQSDAVERILLLLAAEVAHVDIIPHGQAATVSTSVSQQFDENGNRVYANVGLNQRWVLNQVSAAMILSRYWPG